MKRIKPFILVVMMILVSGISILSDFVKFGVESGMFDVGYWINTAVTNLTAICVIFLANSMHKDKCMTENEVFKRRKTELLESYDKIYKLGRLPDLKVYVEEDNRREKLAAYKNKCSAKIEKLNAKIKKHENWYNSVLWFFKKQVCDNPKTPYLYLMKLELKRWENAYANAERVIDFAKVKYKKISYTNIFCISDGGKQDDRDLLFHTAEHNVGIVLKKAILVLFIGFATTFKIIEPETTFSFYLAYKACLRLFSVILAFYTGVTDAEHFVAGQMCDALFKRIRYVQTFLDSIKNKE